MAGDTSVSAGEAGAVPDETRRTTEPTGGVEPSAFDAPPDGARSDEFGADGPRTVAGDGEGRAEGHGEPPPTVASLAALLAGRDEEIAALREQLLRAHAEMENIRKRSERERLDGLRYANTAFARDMVTVADNFQRAIDAVPLEARGDGGPLASLVEGVSMIEREFLKAMARHGVARQEPLSSPFDPNHHQAVMEVPDASVPSGTVVQVLQAGYAIADRVLRPAMVAVSRGGPKVARGPATERPGGANGATGSDDAGAAGPGG
jgi:molecular chaperone GrpE